MHNCPICGAVCSCDGEDFWHSFYPDCEHACDEEDEYDDLDFEDPED